MGREWTDAGEGEGKGEGESECSSCTLIINNTFVRYKL